MNQNIPTATDFHLPWGDAPVLIYLHRQHTAQTSHYLHLERSGHRFTEPNKQMGNPFLPPFSTFSRAARRLEKRKRLRKCRRHSKERNQEEEEEVDMMIRELQKFIPNSTTIEVDCVLDEAIEYLKYLQSEHHAWLEAMRSWETALAASTVGFQRPQRPMGPTLNIGASFFYNRPY